MNKPYWTNHRNPKPSNSNSETAKLKEKKKKKKYLSVFCIKLFGNAGFLVHLAYTANTKV